MEVKSMSTRVDREEKGPLAKRARFMCVPEQWQLFHFMTPGLTRPQETVRGPSLR